MNIPIIFENDNLMVIDKPSGLVVNRADSVKVETLQDWVEEEFRIKNIDLIIEQGEFYQRSAIVHRLDKETSGLLIIAKDPQSFIVLQEQFKERTIKKKYITLVHGIMEAPFGEIVASVGRLPWNRERFGVLAGGKAAKTAYNVLSTYKKGQERYSLIEVLPHTGRTHQIRIHFKYAGHPVVADKFYAGRKTYKKDLSFCPRLFLHACFLELNDPGSKEKIQVISDLSSDLKSALDKLQKE